jgi:hypothetical protein
MKLFCLLTFACSLAAQVTVTFSPGSGLTRHSQRWSVWTCNAGPQRNLDSGKVYQAASTKISPLAVSDAQWQYSRSRRRDPLVILSNGVSIAGNGTAVLIAGGAIRAGSSWLTGALVAGQIAQIISGMLQPDLPPSGIADLLMGTVVLPEGGCFGNSLVAVKMKDAKAFTVTIQ